MLQGRIAGVVVSIDPTDPTKATVYIRGEAATILMDGMRVSDPTFISPCDVEAIDVIRNGNLVAGTSGVISILTKRGDTNFDSGNDKAKGIGIVNIAGYLMSREFYTPRYESLNNTSNFSDLRSTIYWNPEIITDASGKARIIFPLKSSATTLRLEIEGLTDNGKPVAGSFEYEVK
jgi:hypothetical protein